ncbi:hypothetical protein SGRIM128S_06534 [Streptomyces griseomycini]
MAANQRPRCGTAARDTRRAPPWNSDDTAMAPKEIAAIWPGMTPDRAVDSGSKPGSEVSDAPAIAENAVVAANSARRVPRSERSVAIFSHSDRSTGANCMVRPPGAVR